MTRRANIKYFTAPEGQAYCCRCDSYKPKECFTKHKESFTGLNWYCRECVAKNHQKNKEQIALRSKARYGLSPKDYADLLEKQGYVCAICKKPETRIHKGSSATYCVDHDHETGKIRGLLCQNCNVLLGNVSDDIKILKNAVAYLERNNAAPKPKQQDTDQMQQAKARDESILRMVKNLPNQLTGDSSDIENLPLFSFGD